MLTTYDDRQATGLANLFKGRIFEAHRGVVPLEGGRSVVFGNDGYGTDERARNEVAIVRRFCEKHQIPVEGFGVDSEDAYSWALIVRTDDVELLDRFIWDAALESFGEGGTCNSVQRHIAWRRVEGIVFDAQMMTVQK